MSSDKLRLLGDYVEPKTRRQKRDVAQLRRREKAEQKPEER